VAHACEIILRINLPRPAEEELLERVASARAQRINDAAEGDLDGEPLCSLDWHQLEVVRERPHPVRNEVILRKSKIRITACDHFRHIAMRNAEATRKVFDFVGKERVSSGLADKRFDRSAITGTSSCLDRVGLRNACASWRYICKSANAEGIAFSHEQRAPAIARKEPGLRLNCSKLTQRL